MIGPTCLLVEAPLKLDSDVVVDLWREDVLHHAEDVLLVRLPVRVHLSQYVML